MMFVNFTVLSVHSEALKVCDLSNGASALVLAVLRYIVVLVQKLHSLCLLGRMLLT